MDANENIDDEEGALQAFMVACELGCAHEARHHYDPPNSYIRGSKKIDYVLCSRSILPAVRKSMMLPFNQGSLSDHRDYIVEFHAPDLFGGTTDKINPTPKRRFNSQNPYTYNKYITNVRKLFTEHKIPQRARDLKKEFEQHGRSQYLIDQYNKLDEEKCQLLVAAEKKSGKPGHNSGTPWSPELNTAGIRLRYWELRLRQLRTKVSMTSQLQRLAKVIMPEIQISFHTPLSYKEIEA